MAGKPTPVSWRSNDGRTDWDNVLDVSESMTVESVNIALRRGTLGDRRPGSAFVTTTGDSYSGVAALAKFVAAQDESAAQLFLVSRDGTTKVVRITAAATAVNLTLTDAFSGKPTETTFVALNGKLFIGYQSGGTLLHVYDPVVSTTTVRRVGLIPPVAATVANTGAGAYPAVLRYYRIQYRVKSGSTVTLQSELGPSVSFTPSGAGTAARVSLTASTTEIATHWAVYGSTDNVLYYHLADTILATTTYDDSALTSTYNTNEAAPLEGAYLRPFAAKFLASDGVRLFMFGAWASGSTGSITAQPGTVYWTPPLGATGIGDDERIQETVDQEDNLSLSVNAGGVDRGIAGPFYNDIYAFQSKGIYKLVSTGQSTAPFRRVVVSKDYGSVSHWSQVMGEDEQGNDALYFLDPNDGPRRIVIGSGIQWLGKDVNTLWQRVNLAATISVAHGVYDRRAKRILWWLAVDSENEPMTTMIIYDVTSGRSEGRENSVRRGWATWNGSLAAAQCSLMFAKTLAASRPSVECPYIGNATNFARQDGTSNKDATTSSTTTAYQAYVVSKAFDWGLLTRRKRLIQAFVTAEPRANTTLQHTLTKDFGLNTFVDQVSIAPERTETLTRKIVQGLDQSDAITDQITIGDAAAVDTTWSLDRWDGVVESSEAP